MEDEELVVQENNSEDLDSPGTVFAKYKTGIILFAVMVVILITVMVLFVTGVISRFVTNCIIIPIALIVVLYFMIRSRR